MIDEPQLRRICRLRELEESGEVEPRLVAAADAEMKRRLEAGSPPDEALAARAAAAVTDDPRWIERFAPTLLVGGSFLVGFLGDRLISGNELRLLSLPLLGLWLWNLLCYALWAVGRFGRKDGLAGWLSLRFSESRKPLVPLTVARWQATVHVAAIALVLGLVAGMYVGGLAVEYRAVWESTWLSAAQVQSLMSTILTPASALTGIAVPDVGESRAADWIHLFAFQSLLVVGLPRAMLATVEWARATRMARRLSLDLDEPYFRRLLGTARGVSTRVLVVPFGFEPEPASVESLNALLRDALGARSAIETLPSTAYGKAPSLPPIEDPGRTTIVSLFNLAQTPEHEVHGELMTTLAATGCSVVAAIDPNAYADRVDRDRLERRTRSWNDVVSAHHATPWPLPHPRYLSAERASRDEALTAAVEALT